MTRKLIHCPKCGKNSFIELSAREDIKQIKQKDFDRILKAVVSVPPPKKWKEDREKRV